ncbi:MAG TPA: primase-like DNA-binding domain-containing protein [Propionibacteriaceae bacterium]
MSNELPRFGDASGAIANRFVVLAMHQSFLGKENHALTEELTAELTGILSWSLDGLDRLNQQGKFTEPKASADSILALQDLVSPTAAFVRDRCEVGIGHEIAVADLFAAWREWCELNGHRAGSVQSFGRDLRAVIPTIRISQPRVDGGRERYFQGVQLQPESTAHNGADRMPLRASDSNSDSNSPESAPARDGTRENPLWSVLQSNGHVACSSCAQPLDRPNPSCSASSYHRATP